MTAPVRIDAPAWGDLRFATLARLCGFADAEHALIKCAKIWSWQTEHYTPEAPTYEVDPEIVESALGEGGTANMIRARLAEEGPDGIRIKGSKGRIEWLYQKRIASAAGGEATKRKHGDQKRPDGPPPAHVSAGPEPGPKPGPLTLTLLPDQISDSHTPARAIVRPTTWQRRQSWWTCMLEAHSRLRAKGIKPNTPDLAKHPNEQQLLECERFLIEGGYDEAGIDKKMRHVVLVHEAEAEALGHLDFFKPAIIWDTTRADRFPRKVDTSLEEATRRITAKNRSVPQKSKNGTIGSATPRTDHGTDSNPAREVL